MIIAVQVIGAFVSCIVFATLCGFLGAYVSFKTARMIEKVYAIFTIVSCMVAFILGYPAIGSGIACYFLFKVLWVWMKLMRY